MTIVATALPMRFVIERASDMNRSTPSSSARPAIGMFGNAESVAASVMNPLPVTAAAPLEVRRRMPRTESCWPNERWTPLACATNSAPIVM